MYVQILVVPGVLVGNPPKTVILSAIDTSLATLLNVVVVAARFKKGAG